MKRITNILTLSLLFIFPTMVCAQEYIHADLTLDGKTYKDCLIFYDYGNDNVEFIGIAETFSNWLSSSEAAELENKLQSLTSFTIPETVDGKTVIEVSWLGKRKVYSNLESLIFPSSIIKVSRIPDKLFCPNLKTVELNNVQSIGDQAFSYSAAIEYIDLSNVKSIGQYAFRGSDLKSDITLNADWVGSYAFLNCNNLKKVTIMKDMGTEAQMHGYSSSDTRADHQFHSCTALKEVELKESVKNLPQYCFAYCSALDKINIENVETFGSHCLYGCNSLVFDNLEWVDSKRYFYEKPFYGCTFKWLHVKNDYLSFSYTYEGENPGNPWNQAIFEGIKNSHVYIESDYVIASEYVRAYLEKSSDKYYTDASNKFYVPRNYWQGYVGTDGWKDIQTQIYPYPIRHIYIDGEKKEENYSTGLFYTDDSESKTTTLNSLNGQRSGSTLEIPATFEDGYTTVAIGAGACSGNTFTTITLPSTVTTIGSGAFAGSSQLPSIDLSNVTTLGSGCFNGCPVLNKVTLNESLTAIPASMFAGCAQLSNINLDNITHWGADCFNSCYKLERHLDLRKAKSIGANAFKSSGLKSVWLGAYNDATLEIGQAPFESCQNLKIYIAEEDPTKISTNVVQSLGTGSVAYVVSRNITSSEVQKNPLQAFKEHAEWGKPSNWQYVYPMLHQGNAIERQKTYTSFCFDKPLDFRGTTIGTTIDSEDGRLPGMLQYYKQPKGLSTGFITNHIEPLVVTGFGYTGSYTGSSVEGNREKGNLTTANPGIRPANTGVLIQWHPGDEFHGATGMTEYYPIPPVLNDDGSIMTESQFRSIYSGENAIRTGTYENNTGLVNCGGRNLMRLTEGDDEGEYKDNYEGGSVTYENELGMSTTWEYTGTGYDNLMIGNTVRIDSVFYSPWYYRYARDNEGTIKGIDTDNKEYDLNYKQFGLDTNCFFKRFYTYDERKTGSFMRAYRAFLRLPLPQQSAGAKLVDALFEINGDPLDGSTTGISDIQQGTGRNGSYNGSQTGIVYSIDGRIASTNGTDKLPRGIYIRDGKKIVVK